MKAKMMPQKNSPLNEYQLNMLNTMEMNKKILLQQFLEIDFRLAEMRTKLAEIMKVVTQ